MRDAYRMKEKFDVSLDSRQLVGMIMGGIIVLGAVFILGVVMGKKLEGSQRAAQTPDLLTALDQKGAALDQVREGPPLTFQDELTKKAEPVKFASVPAQAPLPVVKVTPHVEPQTPAMQKSVVSAEALAKLLLPQKIERTRDATPTAVRAVAPSVALMKRAPETAPNGSFTLQLGSSPSQDDAKRLAARLRDRGYAPYVISAQVPGKGTWFRVRMGSFPSKDAAQSYLQDFRRESKMEAFVTSTH